MDGGGIRTRADDNSFGSAKASATVSIGINPDDVTRARSLAAKSGLPYQTYLKSLLHEAFERDEQAWV